MKAVWIFAGQGRASVNSLASPPPAVDFSDRDYFRSHIEKDIGIFIGQALMPRVPYQGAAFFSVSRRRPTDDGSFAGVIQASVLPEYFENFYARIGRDAGSFFALGLTAGTVLARFPVSERDIHLDRNGPDKRLPQARGPGSLPSPRRLTASSAGSDIKGLRNIRFMSARAWKPRRSARAG